MKILQNILSAITIAIFIAIVIFYNVEIVYDCTKLHQHRYVPDEVLEECIRIIKTQKSISI